MLDFTFCTAFPGAKRGGKEKYSHLPTVCRGESSKWQRGPLGRGTTTTEEEKRSSRRRKCYKRGKTVRPGREGKRA